MKTTSFWKVIQIPIKHDQFTKLGMFMAKNVALKFNL